MRQTGGDGPAGPRAGESALPAPEGRAVLERLTERPQFLAVAKHGRKTAQPGLVIQALRRAGTDAADDGEAGRQARIGVGFTASRKVGKAVVRNRARRRLRALAAEVLPRHARPGYDLVLIARQATATRPYPDLRADLERGLRRLGLLRASPPAAGLKKDPGS
jgi:ribonuclease P protein component